MRQIKSKNRNIIEDTDTNRANRFALLVSEQEA